MFHPYSNVNNSVRDRMVCTKPKQTVYSLGGNDRTSRSCPMQWFLPGHCRPLIVSDEIFNDFCSTNRIRKLNKSTIQQQQQQRKPGRLLSIGQRAGHLWLSRFRTIPHNVVTESWVETIPRCSNRNLRPSLVCQPSIAVTGTTSVSDFYRTVFAPQLVPTLRTKSFKHGVPNNDQRSHKTRKAKQDLNQQQLFPGYVFAKLANVNHSRTTTAPSPPPTASYPINMNKLCRAAVRPLSASRTRQKCGQLSLRQRLN